MAYNIAIQSRIGPMRLHTFQPLCMREHAEVHVAIVRLRQRDSLFCLLTFAPGQLRAQFMQLAFVDTKPRAREQRFIFIERRGDV